MSGGGTQKKSGSMLLSNNNNINNKNNIKNENNSNDGEQKITLEFIQDLEKKIVFYQNELISCRETKNEIDKNLKENLKNLKIVQIEIEKNKLILNRLIEQNNDFSKKIKNLLNDSNLTENEKIELQDLENKNIFFENEINQTSPNLKNTQIEISSLQRQIKSVGGPKLQKQQIAVDSIISKLENISSLLATKQVEEKNYLKQYEKSKILKEKNEEDVLKTNKKIEILENELQDMKNDAEKLISIINIAKQKKNENENILKNMSKEYNELKNIVNNKKNILLELTENNDNLNTTLKKEKELKIKFKNDSKNIRKIYYNDELEFFNEISTFEKTIVNNNSNNNINNSINNNINSDIDNNNEDENSLIENLTQKMSINDDEDSEDENNSNLKNNINKTNNNNNNNNNIENNTENNNNKILNKNKTSTTNTVIEELKIYSVEELDEFDGDEIKKNLNKFESQKNKFLLLFFIIITI
jgi:hypothetical protein